MTLNECTTADHALNVALVQGLHAFIASGEPVTSSDTQIERAARTTCAQPSLMFPTPDVKRQHNC